MRNPFRGVTQWIKETRRRMKESEKTQLEQQREILLLQPDTPIRARKLGKINRRLAKIGGL